MPFSALPPRPRDVVAPAFLMCCLAGVGGGAMQATTVFAQEIMATAAKGTPYGVGTIELPLGRPVVGNPLPPLEVRDADGRVLYPIARDMRVRVERRPSERPVPRPGRGRLLGRVGELIRELASDEEELEQTVARKVTFLFRGDQPLEVRLGDRRGEIGVYQIVPRDDPAARRDLLDQWWETYAEAAKRQLDSADYPSWVETYLVAMLSGRLGMPLPDWYPSDGVGQEELVDTLKLIAGGGDVDDDVFAISAAGTARSSGPATLPLPDAPAWDTDPVSPNRDGADELATEPIASRVPPEFFYIRYGSFANYLWFRDLSDEYGGDISRMVSLRGFVDDAAARVETQLSLKTTELSRILGPSVIDDQALVGRDLFLSDGASMGVLIRAKNAFLLRTSLNQERSAKASADESIRLTDVEIDGRQVSLLKSSDNRIRSYLAVDGKYVFVTNSRVLVERFFEVGRSGESLAKTPTFREARRLMPLDREDTIFAYFSPQFLQGLASPRYLIELRRRLNAKADVALVHLARIVAASEGEPIRGVDRLIEAGYLPTNFGVRADGSGVIAVGDRMIDSMRGSRGVFLPIADAEIDGVTAEETDWYRGIAREYESQLGALDPIMIGLQREPRKGNNGSGNNGSGNNGSGSNGSGSNGSGNNGSGSNGSGSNGSGDNGSGDNGIERLRVHAEVAPFRPEKYGKLAEQLGPPTRVAMRFAPDDIVSVQAHVASPQLGPPTHLFAAIKDSNPPQPEKFDGILGSYLALRQIPGYLGAWPQPGTLDRLPLGLGRGQPVGPGMSRLIGGVYRYTGGGFSVLSFFPEMMQASLAHLEASEVDDEAQVRIHVGNLVGSQLEGWVNGQLYTRAAEASESGTNFLNLLSRQLGVPPREAPDVAERIFGMRLQCSLGGEYEFDEASGRWVSSAWQGREPADAPAADYIAPVMTWFRGGDATVTQYADRLIANVVIDVERASRTRGASQN